jgi:hypothetical protein
LALTNPPGEIVAGQTIDISGEGCPPEGPVELAQPEQVGVELMPIAPPLHDQIGTVDQDGKLGFVGYALAMAEGSGAQHFVVDEAGEWTGSWPLPDGFQTGDWQLLVSCLTLVDQATVPEPPGLLPAEGTTVVRTYTVG